VSLLSNLGLQDWIANSLAELPALVARNVADERRIATLRRTLPAQMRASALMDAPRFVRNLEDLYRRMWRDAGGDA
jgi:predicted O-linked N-acetylglucosamine transferase (SPINDLY family)